MFGRRIFGATNGILLPLVGKLWCLFRCDPLCSSPFVGANSMAVQTKTNHPPVTACSGFFGPLTFECPLLNCGDTQVG